MSHLIISQNALRALITLMLVLCVSFTWQKVRARDQIAFYAFHSFLASYMSSMRNSNLAPVVETLDSAIRWIVIYPVDSAIQHLNNRCLEIRIAGCLCRLQLGLDALSWIGFTFEPNRMQSMLGIPSQPPERQKTAKKAFFAFRNPPLLSKSKITWGIPRRCLEFRLEACNADCETDCEFMRFHVFFHYRLNFWTHNHFNGWLKELIPNL